MTPETPPSLAPEIPPLESDGDELTPAELRAIADELFLIEQALALRSWETNPTSWVTDRLGDVLWSRQRDVLCALRDHRKVAVASCHQAGKSFLAADAIAWWVDTHPPEETFVVTSAPNFEQVRAVLWRELNRAHARGLPGRMNQTEWYRPVTHARGNETEVRVAFGRKPDDRDMTGFQGLHAKYMLVVLDEADGIPDALWEAADTLIANETSKMLVIGNPDTPTSRFAKVCAAGSGWHVERISAFDTPEFTGEVVPAAVKDKLVGRTWVETKRRAWAPRWRWVDPEGQEATPLTGARCVPPTLAEDETSVAETAFPFWFSKVLGEFPVLGSEAGVLIPAAWITAAQQRTLEADGDDARELGVDLGAGSDATTIAYRRGGRVRVVHRDHNPDTMQTTGRIVKVLRESDATRAKVDRGGLGIPVVDRLRELNQAVVGVDFGGFPVDRKMFVNARSEGFWKLRELFQHGEIDIDPSDDDLATQLSALRYEITSGGQYKLEEKKVMRRRLGRSPDDADAVMLAFYAPKQLVSTPRAGSMSF